MSTAPRRPLEALVHSTGTLHPNASSTSLITRYTSRLADPPTRTVDSALFDLVLNEAISTLVTSVAAVTQRQRQDQLDVERDLERLGFGGGRATGLPAARDGTANGTAGGGNGAKDADKEREQLDQDVRNRLDEMGYKVGWATAERLARDRPRFPLSQPSSAAPTTPASVPSSAANPDPLELVKFICKDLWTALFAKQVDNLRTNHRGVYVLLDQRVRALERVSGDRDQVQRWTRFILAFPSGIIRGALANLGLSSTVSAECNNVPQASFQIKTTPKP
ncbi:hypothetical protein JCM10212_000559 [Sporobolomyces blumeae]